MHRTPTRGRVDQPIETVVAAAPQPVRGPVLIEVKQPTGAASRPTSLEGVVDQIQQAGLDVCVHAYRDRAGGQSQRDFP